MEIVKIINLVNKNKIEDIIHLAAFIDSADPFENKKVYEKNNYELTKKLVREIPNTTIKRFIFASTQVGYGSIKKIKFLENNFKSPQSPYGKSKLKAEIFIKIF